MTDMNTTAKRIAAKEAELAQAHAALAGVPSNPGTSALRGKQHGIRVDGALHRTAGLVDTARRLEMELAGLRGRAKDEAAGPVDLSQLAAAKFVRTRWGWHEIVKVNRATVKVKAAPGMDDLVKMGKILEVR